jgi:hypothetical protein
MILSLLAAVVLTGSEPSAAALAPRFTQVQDALPGEQPSFAGWTRAQLEAEVRRLEDLRPSMGGPITFMAIGAAVLVVDFVAFFFAGFIALLSNTGFPPGATIGISIAALIGAGLLVIGSILLRGIMKERSEYGRQIDLVKAALEAMSPTPIEPPPNVPPAMPIPPQVMLSAPWIAVTLARF